MTVTPQQEISITLNSSEIPFERHNVYFWGDSVCFWGNKGFSKMFRCLEFLFFVARGVLGLCGSGGPIGVFESI